MCCRYYFADELISDVDRIADFVADPVYTQKSKDIHPADLAPVLLGNQQGSGIQADLMRWGFPSFDNKLLINGRAESVLEKKAFSESVLSRRCVLPANCFYEWDREKTKNTFYLPEHKPMFLAGLFNMLENERRFVVLTTEANASMAPVHDRMPLLLEPEQIEPWVLDSKATRELLEWKPGMLEREAEYEQLSLF